MTPRPVLNPRDAQIFDLLTQVRAIVERRGLGTAVDVTRIAKRALPHLPDPQLAAAIQRARAAEAEVRRLRDLLDHVRPVLTRDDEWLPPRREPWRVVELSPRTAEALTEMCEGASIPEVAAHLGIGYSSAVNLLNKAVHDVGAADRAQAVALATSGAVRVRVRKQMKGRAA